MVDVNGGLKTAKILIHQNAVTTGFIRLWELKRLDLSIEALVLKEKYHDLFTDKERKVCIDRLNQYQFDINTINN